MSDGLHSPDEVAQICAEEGVDIWSLTDHDSCLGCASAAQAAQRLGIHFISGIEISAYEERSIHVLGYGVRPDGPIMEEYGERRLDMRVTRMEKMVSACRELGLEITMSDVERFAGDGGMGRPHLAKALVDVGEVETEQAAFDRLIAYGQPAYRATKWPSVPEAIDIIAQAGGVSVAAHPGSPSTAEKLEGWVDDGLDGIEVVHPSHTLAQTEALDRLATRLGVLRTASSDFHGRQHYSAEYFGSVDFPEPWLQSFLDACG